ncbi:helix-turn-helix transcriptional regulator [Celeribacter marinus]|uniref:helix-turn-helix transcriptional regulator n=1 Tax=Celeribacter marinus TaxID=1397108 RepID=UPI003F6D4F3F
MTAALEKFLEHIQHVETFQQLQLESEHLRDILGIKHVVYHWVNSAGERFGVGTYSSEWVDRYLAKDYLRLDPVLFGCFQRFTPVNWKQLDWSSRSARTFFLDALEYGVGSQGFSVPVRGPNGQFALFTLNDDATDAQWEKFIQSTERALVICAHEFNKKALDFESVGASAISQPLSPREVEALTCLAKGLSRAQTALQMGISEHTLRVYIEAARHKLGAMNTTHAVARALSIGVIII